MAAAGFLAALKGLAGQGLKLLGTADWAKVQKMFGSRLSAQLFSGRAKEIAMKQALALLERRMVKAVRSRGMTVGRPWPENAASTIDRKGSSTPLIDKGDLIGNIHPHYVNENFGFIGVKRGTIHRGTKGDVVDLAEILHFGVLAKDGGASGKRWRIPPRPFVKRTLKAHGKAAGYKYAEIIEKMYGSGGDAAGALVRMKVK